MSERAAVTPAARAALVVHAHLRLALAVVDTDAATPRGPAAATERTAPIRVHALVGGSHRRRERPVRRLRVVVDVVQLAVARVRHLPAGRQRRRRGLLRHGLLVVRVGVCHDLGG